MSYVSLEDFQKLTGISDSALLWLLKRQNLVCEIGQSGILQIDIESAHVKSLIEALAQKQTEVLAADRDLLFERISGILLTRLDDIVARAVVRVKSRIGET